MSRYHEPDLVDLLSGNTDAEPTCPECGAADAEMIGRHRYDCSTCGYRWHDSAQERRNRGRRA